MFKQAVSSYVTEVSSKQEMQETPITVDESPEAVNTKAATMLMAYLAFKQPDKKRRQYLIPKDRAAWLEYLVQLVKKKTTIEYLSEKELRKVVIRARPNLAGKKPVYQDDPDAPICMKWSVEQTAEWASESGFPYLKEAFLLNRVSGRRLITIDCSVLNRMGMSDLTEMMKVTAKIRELLQIPKPNMLRALMRIPPFESYLRSKVSCGKTYDLLTFEKFCKQEGFNYVLLKNNKNALIPCTCEVRIVPNGVVDDDEEELVESEEEDLSLLNAPTVEYIVRNVVVRDKTVSTLIEDIMESVFSPPDSRRYGKPIADSFRDALGRAYDELGVMTSEERLEFSTSVANALLDELRRTTEILNDIQELQKYIKEEVSPEQVQHMQDCAEEFMENVMPIASLLALGELDLETIFKQQPEFVQLVDEVCEDAEATTNALVPDALQFVESVIKLATKKVKEMSIPGLSVETIASAKSIVLDVLHDTMNDAEDIVTNAVVAPSKYTTAMTQTKEHQPTSEGEGEGSDQDSQVDFADPADVNEVRETYLKQEDEIKAAKQKALAEVKTLHLGEGQKEHTVAHAQGQLDKPYHPRTHHTLSNASSQASRSAHPSPNPSHSGRSRPISAVSILSHHSEKGDQALRETDKTEEKERLERLKAIRAVVRHDKEEKEKKRTVKGPGKLSLENGKILDLKGKLVGMAGKNFTILAEDGKTVIGFVDKTGTAYTDDGTMLGKFDINKRKKPEEVNNKSQVNVKANVKGELKGTVQSEILSLSQASLKHPETEQKRVSDKKSVKLHEDSQIKRSDESEKKQQMTSIQEEQNEKSQHVSDQIQGTSSVRFEKGEEIRKKHPRQVNETATEEKERLARLQESREQLRQEKQDWENRGKKSEWYKWYHGEIADGDLEPEPEIVEDDDETSGNYEPTWSRKFRAENPVVAEKDEIPIVVNDEDKNLVVEDKDEKPEEDWQIKWNKEQQEKSVPKKSETRMQQLEKLKASTAKGRPGQQVKETRKKVAGELELQDGKILDFNGKIVGFAGQDFKILAEDGKTVIGFVDKSGAAFTMDGTILLGRFGISEAAVNVVISTGDMKVRDGKIRDNLGKVVGITGKNFTILAEDGETVIGTVDKTGKMFTNDGKKLGQINVGEKKLAKDLNIEDGKILDSTGKLVGIAGKDFKIMAPDGKTSIGFVDKTGTAFKEDGTMLGKVGLPQVTKSEQVANIWTPKGPELNLKDGKILDSSGKVLGLSGKDSTILAQDGKTVIGYIDKTGTAFKTDGTTLGNLGSPEMTKSKQLESIWTVKSPGDLSVKDGKILDFTGKIVGLAGKDFKILGRDGKTVIGYIDETGTAFKTNGTILGDFGLKDTTTASSEMEHIWNVKGVPELKIENGKIFDFKGAVIGTADKDGTILADDGKTVVGSVDTTGAVYTANGQILGTFDHSEKTKTFEEKVLEKKESLKRAEELKFEDGQILDGNGKLIGVAGDDFKILAEDGKTVIGYVDETGSAFTDNGKRIGSFDFAEKKKSFEERKDSSGQPAGAVNRGRVSTDAEAEKERKRIAQEKLEKLQKEWQEKGSEDAERRRLLKLQQEVAEKKAKASRLRKSQGENAKQIWDEMHGLSESSSVAPSVVDSDNLERLIIQRERNRNKSRKKEVNQAQASEPEHLVKMRLKRKEMVEQWARQTDGGMSDSEIRDQPDEQARLVRITADQIVTEVITYALTHMLLEAEAGKNTHPLMNALKQIQCSDTTVEDRERDVTLWKPNLPRFRAVKNMPNNYQGVSFAPPQQSSNAKTVPPVKGIDAKEQIQAKTEKILTSALKKKSSVEEVLVQNQRRHHHHREGHHHRERDPNDPNHKKPHRADAKMPKEILPATHHHHRHDEDHNNPHHSMIPEVDEEEENTRL